MSSASVLTCVQSISTFSCVSKFGSPTTVSEVGFTIVLSVHPLSSAIHATIIIRSFFIVFFYPFIHSFTAGTSPNRMDII